MFWKKVGKSAQRRGVVASGDFGGGDVEILVRDGKFVVCVEDFKKDLQGGVFSEMHKSDSLESAMEWAENTPWKTNDQNFESVF